MNRIQQNSATRRLAKRAIAAVLAPAAFAVLVLQSGCEGVADDRTNGRDPGEAARGTLEPDAPVAPEPEETIGGDGGEASEETPEQVATADVAAEGGDEGEGDAAQTEPNRKPEAEAPSETTSADASAEDSAERGPSAAARRIDLGLLFLDAAPLPPPPPTPQLATLLESVRRAMHEREFLALRRHLQSAASYRRTDADRQAYERMLLVHALWTQGWSHAIAAAGALSPGDRIDTWAGPALVQDKTESEIMLRIDGVPRTFPLGLSEMEAPLAAALVRHRARETGLALDAHAAALLTFAGDGVGEGGGDALEAAREAIIEAAQRGAYVDHLIAELRHRE